MSVDLYRESPGKFDSRTLSRKTLSRWTGRNDSGNSHTNATSNDNNNDNIHSKQTIHINIV